MPPPHSMPGKVSGDHHVKKSVRAHGSKGGKRWARGCGRGWGQRGGGQRAQGGGWGARSHRWAALTSDGNLECAKAADAVERARVDARRVLVERARLLVVDNVSAAAARLAEGRAGGRALLVIQELAPHAGGELEAAEEAAEEAEDSEEHGGADDNRYDHLCSRVHAGLLRWERELSGEGVGREGALAHAVDVDVAWGVEQDARDSALTILLLPHRTRFALALPPVGLAERRRISDPWCVQPSLCRATSAGPGIPALGWWRTATGRGRSRRRSCPW